MKTLFFTPIAVTVCLFSATAMAQAVSAATVNYLSPIADYQPFVDEKVTSWKAANDKVGQIGGWRAYAKEAQQPENTPSLMPAAAPVTTPPTTPSSTKIDPHAGHKQ